MIRVRAPAVELTIYGRGGCHLCELMKQALSELAPELGFSLAEVDIDSSPSLRARYNWRVPVLAHGEHEICQYQLDRAALEAHLARSGFR